jgi:hypothetical protein
MLCYGGKAKKSILFQIVFGWYDYKQNKIDIFSSKILIELL